MVLKNSLTRQRNRRASAVGGAGPNRGPRVPRRVVRTPKRQFDTLQLVTPAFSGSIVGEIQGIDSPTGEYSAYFMNTTNGPALVVGHLGGQDGIASPTDATAEELAGDIRQIEREGPDGAVPNTIVMRVAAGDEAATRASVQHLVDTLNADGGPQRDLAEQASQPTDRGTVGLVFSLVPRPAAVGPAADDPAARPDDGPEVPQGPPPAPGLAAAAVAAANVAAGRPAPRDPGDLHSDVPVVHVMTLAEFDRATRTRSLRARTPEYSRLRSALAAYHDGVADYRAAAEGAKSQITALGAGKVAVTTELNARGSELAGAEAALQADVDGYLAASMKVLDLRQERVDAVDGAEISRIDEELAAAEADVATRQEAITGPALGARRDRIARLRAEIADRRASLTRIDANLRTQIAANAALLTRHTDELARRAEQIVVDGRAYLLSKGITDPNDKQRIVADVVNQASDPDQHLQRLKEEAGSLWSAEFRHQLAKPAERLETGTASDVFLVETYGPIGGNERGVRTGYAKRALTQGDPPNDTTVNLGFQDRDGGLSTHPNLIARQVVSSRLARELGLDCIAHEVFSADADGRVAGITAKAAGTQVRRNLGRQTLIGADGRPRTDVVMEFARFNLEEKGALQKALSDLQMIDALTGQMDRHLGNIFIDEDGDPPTVTGIDNDMAFAIDGPVTFTNNTLGSFVQVGFEPRTETAGEKRHWKFDQEQIDAGTAARFMAMTDADLEMILSGRDSDPERLGDAEIGYAKTRLAMIKTRIRELMNKVPSGLITEWGPDTMKQALANASRNGFDLNYASRIHLAYEAAGDPANLFSRQEVQGGGGTGGAVVERRDGAVAAVNGGGGDNAAT